MSYLIDFDCPKTGCYFKNSSNEVSFYLKKGEGIFYHTGDFLNKVGGTLFLQGQSALSQNVETIQQIFAYSQSSIGDQQNVYNSSFSVISQFSAIRPYLGYLQHPVQGALQVCFYSKYEDSGIYFRKAPLFNSETLLSNLNDKVLYIQSAYLSGVNTFVHAICENDKVYKIKI